MSKTTIKSKANKLAKTERQTHKHQLHVHLICISLSVVIGIGLSFIPTLMVIHVAAFVIPSIPAALQEILDKVIYGEMTGE